MWVLIIVYCASLQFWWMHQHSALSTLLLSDHSMSFTVGLKDTLCMLCWNHLHSTCTQSTFILSDHSTSSTVDLNDRYTMPPCIMMSQSTLLLSDHLKRCHPVIRWKMSLHCTNIAQLCRHVFKGQLAVNVTMSIGLIPGILSPETNLC